MVKQRWYQLVPWIRFISAIIGFLLIAFCVAVIVFGSNSSSNDIISVILAGIGALLGLFAWFFPFSSEKSERFLLPLAPNLPRESLRMGDDDAAYFLYITTPIQYAYDAAKQAILDASTGVCFL